MERYAIAIGPKLQNTAFDCISAPVADDMAYGTCVDITIVLNDKTYYIPAIIVDVKAHTAPTGIFQTGVDFKGNGIAEDPSSIVEWYTYMEENGKNKSKGLNKFNRTGSIIIYRGEKMR